MSLLYNVIFKQKSTSTHHKIALDALRHLKNPNADRWFNLFLKYNDTYLVGAKDPDKRFHDFKNHVLHTDEGYWGGATIAATQYYNKLVSLLREQNWEKAIYAAGVLSHYFSDPVQPLHTGQEEAEGKIHKVFEWAISKSYDDLQEILETKFGGYPEILTPSGEKWLETMIKNGASLSHQYYYTILDHYDFEKGVKNPIDGMDETLNNIISQLIGYAVSGFAAVLDRAFEEANVIPPKPSLTIRGYLATLKIPIYWILRKLADNEEKKIVKAIYEEVQQKGKAIESLPLDDKEVRALHAKEVLKISLDELDKIPPKPTGTKHGVKEQIMHPLEKIKEPQELLKKEKPQQPDKTEEIFPVDETEKQIVENEIQTTTSETSSEKTAGKTLRWYLELDDTVEKAPSIGKKTASYLKKAGILTIKDLLNADPEKLSKKLRKRWITPETIKLWQVQAKLAYQIPQIRGHDAKILANSGITDASQLLSYSPEELLEKIKDFVNSKEGERVLRGSSKPGLEEVSNWIEWAKDARK